MTCYDSYIVVGWKVDPEKFEEYVREYYSEDPNYDEENSCPYEWFWNENKGIHRDYIQGETAHAFMGIAVGGSASLGTIQKAIESDELAKIKKHVSKIYGSEADEPSIHTVLNID